MSQSDKRGPDGLTDAECDEFAMRFARHFGQQRADEAALLRGAVRSVLASKAVTFSGAIDVSQVPPTHALALLALHAINESSRQEGGAA